MKCLSCRLIIILMTAKTWLVTTVRYGRTFGAERAREKRGESRKKVPQQSKSEREEEEKSEQKNASNKPRWIPSPCIGTGIVGVMRNSVCVISCCFLFGQQEAKIATSSPLPTMTCQSLKPTPKPALDLCNSNACVNTIIHPSIIPTPARYRTLLISLVV